MNTDIIILYVYVPRGLWLMLLGDECVCVCICVYFRHAASRQGGHHAGVHGVLGQRRECVPGLRPLLHPLRHVRHLHHHLRRQLPVTTHLCLQIPGPVSAPWWQVQAEITS